MSRGRWVRSPISTGTKLSELEKAAIRSACQTFIDTVLKPRFLPEIRVTPLNYPVDIRGAFHGRSYRFLQRYRSGYADNLGWEFDAPFARLECVGRDRFDISFRRHTEQWFCLYRDRSLAEALKLIESDGHLHPL
jgi:hypothetical protein